jgi:nitrite reductase (NO-forming)
VWVLDAGPSQSSSFHVIGTIFDTVYKEGAYLLRPGPDQGGSQALDLQAAQGGFVEFTPTEAGSYAFVTHKFNDASRGALGIFQVGAAAPMSH